MLLLEKIDYCFDKEIWFLESDDNVCNELIRIKRYDAGILWLIK